MRIGLITGSFLPALGGLEWKVHYLASEYIKRGHEVVVFCQKLPKRLDGPLPLRPAYQLVKVGPRPFRGAQRSGLQSWIFSRRVLRYHRRLPFDLLHCHNIGIPTRIGAMVKASTGLPVFATTCGDDILTIPSLKYGIRLSPYYEAMVRDNLRRVDAVGSLSSAIRQELESLGGTARIFDIPNGVDWETFQTGARGWLQKRLNLGENTLILVSLGRLNELKGYPTGLRAFSLAARQIQNLHYVIAGAGTNALEGLVCRLNLKERVHLLGSVPMKDIPHLLHSADLFLSPSLSEGFSQAVVQALCCGLPCVVSDCSGNEDLDGRPGILMAKVQDPASMAKAIEVIALNRPLRLRMSKEARSWSRRYAWSEISETYLRIFRELTPSAAF